MIKYEVNQEQFDALNKVLKDLHPSIYNKSLQIATNRAMRVAAKEMKSAAPRSEEKTSVQKKYGYKKLFQEIRVIRLRRVGKGQKASRVDTGNAFWAMFNEFGTKYQPPRPFFMSAFERARVRVIDAFKKEIIEAINKNLQKAKK